MNKTPLRYPGGKSVMTDFIFRIIKSNNLRSYAEPYAGGAGVAINLLLDKTIEHVFINDIDLGIYSFWYYLVNNGEHFLDLFDRCGVNLEEWYKQKEIFVTSLDPSLELGFATFFLSRTNRSGILKAGPIGGNSIEKQSNATYKIDCRFRKENLRKRLVDIIARKDQIQVSNLDAITFLERKCNRDDLLVYLDPPYYVQGKALYTSFYSHKDHEQLSDKLKGYNPFKWLISYDNVPETRSLYDRFDLYQFGLTYSAQNIKKGSELLTHDPRLIIPDLSIRKGKNPIVLEKL